MKITIEISQKEERVVDMILRDQTHRLLNSENIEDWVIMHILTKVNAARGNSSPFTKAKLILRHMIEHDVISENDIYDDLRGEIADICHNP